MYFNFGWLCEFLCDSFSWFTKYNLFKEILLCLFVKHYAITSRIPHTGSDTRPCNKDEKRHARTSHTQTSEMERLWPYTHYVTVIWFNLALTSSGLLAESTEIKVNQVKCIYVYIFHDLMFLDPIILAFAPAYCTIYQIDIVYTYITNISVNKTLWLPI